MSSFHMPHLHVELPHWPSEEQKETVRFDASMAIGVVFFFALGVGVLAPLVIKLFS